MATQSETIENARSTISLAELEAAVNRADPSAFLVESRVLRRVIKYERRITSVGVQAPHRKSFVLDRGPLLEVVEPDEIYPRRPIPENVILLVRPDTEQLETLGRENALRQYWRLLFHARVHIEMDRSLASGKLTSAAVRERVHRIGQTEFDEVRSVLRSEDMLLPPRDERSVYVEFAAVFLELRYFAPDMLPRFFPGIADSAAIVEVLAGDIDSQTLYESCRPPGAPDPDPASQRASAEGVKALAPEPKSRQRRRDELRYRRLAQRADRKQAAGNVARAAILHTRAARYAAPKRADEARGEARAEIEALVNRLAAALNLDNDDAQRWGSALRALVDECGGTWPVEARLLYDLQKVCVDFERETFTVDLPEWLFSLGRRPVRRSLPMVREVLMCKHLRSAAKRLPAVRIAETYRRRLAELLTSATHRAEEKLRQRLRPSVVKSLDAVDMLPRNVPERVARRKLIEELIDRIVEHGYLTVGDLRDAISRNNFKLPDLPNPKAFLVGDHLLNANRQLADTLDGVYRPAEFYLRVMQRLSAAAFSNRVGRFFTRFVAVPFGGAFVAMEGVKHLVHLFVSEATPAAKGTAGNAPAAAAAYVASGEFWTWLLLGLFILGMVNFANFRAWIGRGFKHLRDGVARCYQIMAPLVPVAFCKRVLRSRAFLFTRRYVLKPALFTAMAWFTLNAMEFTQHKSAFGLVMLFFCVNLLVNSRLGRDAEEITNDLLGRAWVEFRVRVLAGIFWFVIDLFKSLLEGVDRLLYAVDEWLRFKSGDSAVSFAAKAVLGSLWFVVTYVVRFCLNLLIEPQINPIKHFPVVTVSHKLLFPTIPLLAKVFEQLGYDTVASYGMATTFIWCIPGIFGFLVWELKENWKLYRANRAANLKPAIIGAHGETLLRYLKPGLHSGTLPKLYRRLRRAERKGYWTGEKTTARKQLDQLEHVKETLRHFVERELTALLAESRAWSPRVTVGEVHAGSNSIRLELRCVELGQTSAWLAFDEQSGWLVGSLSEPGWTASLAGTQRRVFRNALIGLYKTGGVHLVREQIEMCLPTAETSYDISDEGLVVWPGSGYETELAYDLTARPRIEPRWIGGRGETGFPSLAPAQLLLPESPVSWQEWVLAWETCEHNEPGNGKATDLLPDICVLRA